MKASLRAFDAALVNKLVVLLLLSASSEYKSTVAHLVTLLCPIWHPHPIFPLLTTCIPVNFHEVGFQVEFTLKKLGTFATFHLFHINVRKHVSFHLLFCQQFSTFCAWTPLLVFHLQMFPQLFMRYKDWITFRTVALWLGPMIVEDMIEHGLLTGPCKVTYLTRDVCVVKS